MPQLHRKWLGRQCCHFQQYSHFRQHSHFQQRPQFRQIALQVVQLLRLGRSAELLARPPQLPSGFLSQPSLLHVRYANVPSGEDATEQSRPESQAARRCQKIPSSDTIQSRSPSLSSRLCARARRADHKRPPPARYGGIFCCNRRFC